MGRVRPISGAVTLLALLNNLSSNIAPVARQSVLITSKMVTNKELNDRREPGCDVVLADKKYFHVGQWFMKRTLRRHEWQSVPDGTLVIPPTTYPQRWTNDAANLRFLRKVTNIPLPPAECIFEDDGAFYFQSQFVEGVSMKELKEEEKQTVARELEQYVEVLRSLRSDLPGVPGEELLCPPQRVTNGQWKPNSCWKPRHGKGEYVFCHNDLGQHNVIVDPETIKIKAIIDWEFGGFWPAWFEKPFWRRPGPSVNLAGEHDDVHLCRDWLMTHCEEVVMPQQTQPGAFLDMQRKPSAQLMDSQSPADNQAGKDCIEMCKIALDDANNGTAHQIGRVIADEKIDYVAGANSADMFDVQEITFGNGDARIAVADC